MKHLFPNRWFRRKWIIIYNIVLVVAFVVQFFFLISMHQRVPTTYTITSRFNLHGMPLYPGTFQQQYSNIQNDRQQFVNYNTTTTGNSESTSKTTIGDTNSIGLTKTASDRIFNRSNNTLNFVEKTPLKNLFDQDYHKSSFKRPTLLELAPNHRNNVIVGDVNFLLDFAIIGFAKAGTSTMMEWLGLHSQISCFQGETPHLSKGKVGLFIKRLYNGLDPDPLKLHGYKNPTDIQNLRTIRYLREYFPNTKLFIGIRHPILWFQSFYNYRIQNTGKMLKPEKLAAGCNKDSQNVCGKRAHYHLALSRLGKTNYSFERDAYSQAEWEHLQKDNPVRSPNPVFLYDTQQLADKDRVRSKTFRKDIADFLGLTIPLDENPHYSPGKTNLTLAEQADRDAKKIRICDNQHRSLRHKLLEASQHAAYWIRTYFIHAPDVYVSNLDHFEEIMDSYMHDPCESSTEIL